MAPPTTSSSSSGASSTSKKRRANDQVDSGSNAKIAKVHPFFTKTPTASNDPSAPFKWLPSLGPKQTCLHATNLHPTPSAKVAAFDLDGTIIESNVRSNNTSWKWWRNCVKDNLRDLVQHGYALVIISNQGIKKERLGVWKEKVGLIAGALPDVPFRLFAATAKDGHRKPMPGMWTDLERIFAESNVTIDKDASFFVGDAAGRKGDFAGTDRKWAMNVGIKFLTPEEHFLGLPTQPYELLGFNVSSLPANRTSRLLLIPRTHPTKLKLTAFPTVTLVPLFTPTSTPLLPSSTSTSSTTPKSPSKSPSLTNSKSPSKSSKSQPTPHPETQEIVLFVGYPASGKSSFFHRHFAEAGYAHVNQDMLGSKPKCVKRVEEVLGEGGSCVVDNTNRDKATRKTYIALAKKHKVKIRCFYFTASMELAWHNNLYRAYIAPTPTDTNAKEARSAVPYLAFTGFRSAFEEPEMDEGFDEVKKINFVWEGGEEERKRWEMWLQVDGK
ncbi:hypothetical protein ONZ45_g14072 [Pleurotus djamor]|nr:hypothetical protein ONZ45_g14072 [Pleurotus djamor]